MRVNHELSAAENLLALVVDGNVGQTLQANQVTIGGVTEYTEGGAEVNSQVTLSAVQDAGFSGQQTFFFRRLQLSGNEATTASTTFTVEAGDDEQSLLAKLATHLKLIESEITVANFVAPVNENNDGSIDVLANVGSLVYLGQVAITLKIADADVPMDQAFANQTLNGFEDAQEPV